MTAWLEMKAANFAIRELYGPAFDRFVEEERELSRRMATIGDQPGWWRPRKRREWRKSRGRIHYEWATWCVSRSLGIRFGAE